MADNEQQLENLKKSIEALEERIGKLGDTTALSDTTKELEKLKGSLKGFEEYGLPVKKLAEDFEKLKQSAETALEPFEKFDNALKRTFKTLTGVTDASDTLVGSLFKMKSEGKSNTEVFEQFKKTANKTFSALNVGTSIVRKVVEASFLLSAQMHKQTAAFNAQTGAGGKYNAQLREGEKANREFGISLEQMAASRMTLMDGLSGYGVMQAEEQMRLTDLTAQYGKLGVSSADAAGILETSTRVLGQSTAETERAIEETRLLAQGIGISLPKAMSDLNAALPLLAAFGSEATDIFRDLEKQSQETGLAVNELIGISEGFMTFDAAATAAGNLNAVLGTQMFDTMGLLEAQLEGPDAFINMLRTQLQGSVGDFETLNVFQKKAVASAAGMGVAQLSSLMNSQDAITENTELQTGFNDALAAGRSLFEELAILGKQLMISLQGPMEVLGKVFSVVNSILGKIPDVIKGSAALVGGTMLAIRAAKTLGAIAPGSSPGRPIFTKEVGSMGGRGGRGGSMLRQPRRRPRRIAGPSGSGGAGKGGLFGMGKGFSGKGFGLGMGASFLGSGLQAAGYEKTGGALKGAGTGAMIGAMFGPGGALIGGGLGAIGGALGLFADGTDSTPKGPALVGEKGPELLVPPPGSAVINNSAMTAAMSYGPQALAASRQQTAATQALMGKIEKMSDRPVIVKSEIKLDRRVVGTAINEHMGGMGSSPVAGVG